MKAIPTLCFSLLMFPFLVFGQNALPIPDTLSGPVIHLTPTASSITYYSTPTQTMGFNGDILGPTLIMERGNPVTIHVHNQLPDTTTVHWHGMHVSPENDGGPYSIILPGDSLTNFIPVLDHAATYWYHPHLHMRTNEQVTKGLAGFIIVRDAAERALALPRTYGVDDIPIVVQSRDFDANNQFLVGTEMDTALLVNGVLDPYVDLPAQVVRLRLLNGSSQRTYNYGFTGGLTFHMITSDGGLLPAPVALTQLKLSPGERAEILLDLQGLQGQSIALQNIGSALPNGIYGATQPGRGSGQVIPGYTSNPLNGGDFDILQINVGPPTPSAITAIPNSLVPLTPWAESQADTSRFLEFTPVNFGQGAIEGPFQIDSVFFNHHVINQTVRLGDIEIWSLYNHSPISHPFHIHNVQFYVLDINSNPPPAHQQGRKDVILVEPMDTVRFITRFEDFANDTLPYMYHCHMLTHEDEGMMHQFLVIDTLQTHRSDPSQSSASFTLFPNPTEEEHVTIKLPTVAKSEGKLRVFTPTGSLAISDTFPIGTTEFSLGITELPAGCYTVKLQFKEGNLVRKMVKF